MAKLKGRARGPRRAIWAATVAWKVWRRLPASRRRQILALARKHGPKLVRRAYRTRKAMKRVRGARR